MVQFLKCQPTWLVRNENEQVILKQQAIKLYKNKNCNGSVAQMVSDKCGKRQCPFVSGLQKKTLTFWVFWAKLPLLSLHFQKAPISSL